MFQISLKSFFTSIYRNNKIDNWMAMENCI